MGMVQSRGGARFALKAFQGLAVVGKMFRQELECHEPCDLCCLGFDPHTHAPPTQLLENAVIKNVPASHCSKTESQKFVRATPKDTARHNGLRAADNGRMTHPKSQIQNDAARLS